MTACASASCACAALVAEGAAFSALDAWPVLSAGVDGACACLLPTVPTRACAASAPGACPAPFAGKVVTLKDERIGRRWSWMFERCQHTCKRMPKVLEGVRVLKRISKVPAHMQHDAQTAAQTIGATLLGAHGSSLRFVSPHWRGPGRYNCLPARRYRYSFSLFNSLSLCSCSLWCHLSIVSHVARSSLSPQMLIHCANAHDGARAKDLPKDELTEVIVEKLTDEQQEKAQAVSRTNDEGGTELVAIRRVPVLGAGVAVRPRNVHLNGWRKGCFQESVSVCAFLGCLPSRPTQCHIWGYGILFLVHCFGWLTVCSVTLCIVGGRFLQLCAPRALHISCLHQARCPNSFRKHSMLLLHWYSTMS